MTSKFCSIFIRCAIYIILISTMSKANLLSQSCISLNLVDPENRAKSLNVLV